jgi:snurportin-1
MERLFVKKSRSDMAAKRRSDMLKKQQHARRNLVYHARQLATDSIETSSLKKKTREHRMTAIRDYYSRQLLVPEWMTEVPADLNGKGSLLGEGWYVLPRPEGKRCIVISNKYTSYTYLRITDEE